MVFTDDDLMKSLIARPLMKFRGPNEQEILPPIEELLVQKRLYCVRRTRTINNQSIPLKVEIL
jgi:hypothetical protein